MIEERLAKKTVRKDKLKNQAEVIKVIAKDPTLTEREVAKEAWIGNWTAHRHIKELEQSGADSKIMDSILEKDNEIMNLVNALTLNHIREKIENGEKLDSAEVKILWDLANNSTKRKAIFWDNGANTPSEVIISL